jgi:multidrug efflux pump subunit AcrA (membrane-fusion protein)
MTAAPTQSIGSASREPSHAFATSPAVAEENRRFAWPARIAAAIGVLAVVAVVGYFVRPTVIAPRHADALTHRVARRNLSVTVTENGTVESSNNKEIKCLVKGGSTVLWVVETGTIVQAGDELVRLDQAQIEDNILAQRIVYENALANKITAESQVAVAKTSITEYVEGTFVEERDTIEKEIFDAEQAYTSADLAYQSAMRLAAKGLISPLQLDGERFAVDSARKELALKKVRLRTLDQYKKHKQLETFTSDLRAAEAQLASYDASLKLEETRLEREKEQLKNCVIKAEVAGMVIFPSMAQWKETPDIEEGAVVREQQTLLMIPDVTQMQVKVGIHESKVDRLRVGMRAQVELQNLKLEGQVGEIADVTKPAGWWTGNLVKYDTIIKLAAREGLKPGMSAVVDVVLASYDDVVAVPVAAILQSDDQYLCWVKTEQGFVARPIQLGDTDDEFTIVTAGLVEGDEIALNPLAFIEDAQRRALRPAGPTDQGEKKSSEKDSSAKPDRQVAGGVLPAKPAAASNP